MYYLAILGVKHMPLTISGKKYYRTQEALELIGLPRSTYFKWLKEEKVEDTKYKDRNGWRLFTDDDIKKLKRFKETITTNK